MKLKEPDFNLAQIKLYSENKDLSNVFQVLSEQTCSDLDFDRFYETINRTSSCVGQQYFYDQLRCIPIEADAAKYKNIIAYLKEDSLFADRCRKLISSLSNRNAYYICSLFQETHPVPGNIRLIVHKILQFLPFLFVSLFIIFSYPVWMILAFITFSFNLFFHYRNKQTLFIYLYSIPQYLKLVSIAKKLYSYEIFHTINPQLKEQLNSLQPLTKRLSFFKFDLKFENDMAVLIMMIKEITSTFFLFEPNILFSSFQLLNEKKNDIEKTFSFIGCIDMLLSISYLEKIIPPYCRPQWTTNNLSFTGIYHPLIESCVTNSLNTRGKSVLLTGSNMSGKTTFIRTIALNMLSAHCLNLCFAETFSSPKLKIHTAINLSDDLAASTSFYMQEVLNIKDMLLETKSKGPHLFLLDELFKGTNTLERIAGGKAVLSALASNGNIVFASTHDLELADLLADEFWLYHFCEQIANNQLTFDYLLKEGKLKHRNAIRLLELENYPLSVIQEVNNIVEELLRSSHNSKLSGSPENE